MGEKSKTDQSPKLEARRKFLAKAGKIVIYTPPALMLLMNPSKEALATSAGGPRRQPRKRPPKKQPPKKMRPPKKRPPKKMRPPKKQPPKKQPPKKQPPRKQRP